MHDTNVDTENVPVGEDGSHSMLPRSLGTSRAASSSEVDPKLLPCVICGNVRRRVGGDAISD